MPLVTDSDRPRGAPAATTAWPTCSESDLAKTAGVRFCCPSTLMTARSLVSELPTTVAGTVRPSPKVTVMVPPSEAPSTTCALVRMWPSLSMTTPLPRPLLPPFCTLMVTREGSILAAAAPTVPSSLGLWAAGTVLTLIGEVADPDAELREAYEPTPAPAPSTADSDAAASRTPALRRGLVVAAGPYALSVPTPVGDGKSGPLWPPTWPAEG